MSGPATAMTAGPSCRLSRATATTPSAWPAGGRATADRHTGEVRYCV
jgi:hypothetical protein